MNKVYHAIQLSLFPTQKPSPITVTLICDVCNKEFQRGKIQHEYSISKHGIKPVYCSSGCINTRFKTLPIPLTIGEEYLQGSNLLDIAKRYNTSESVIWHRLIKMGVPMRKDNTRWKNGHPLHNKGGHTEQSKQIIREAAIRQFSRPGAREEDALRTTQQMMSGKLKKISKLEDLVAEELSKRNITFTRQFGVNIQGTKGYIGCVDFMLDDGRAIEVNGTYWHTDPRKYPDGPKNETQKSAKEKYNNKMTRLAQLDIPVIELWEIDLKADLIGTLDKAL